MHLILTARMIATLPQPQRQRMELRPATTGVVPLIYIAAPYTHDDPVANTHAVIRIADALLAAGFTPLIPHLTLAWQLVSPKPYDTWLDYDCKLLSRCDAVLRVPGYSPGATRETTFADRQNIPVIRPWTAAPDECIAAVRAWLAER